MHSTPRLGLRENLAQFSLLVLVNAFVGAMVGMERSVLPLMAEREFGVASNTAILSFLISFGVTKAFSNLFAGGFSDRFGRKRLLVAGWLFALPVPFLLRWAPGWEWVVAANILLGINQGLCWSTTVIMKIDLTGSRQRGLAMGLNEFAGYLSVAVAAYAAAVAAESLGIRESLYYLGLGFAAAGLVLSTLFARETLGHARYEAGMQSSESPRQSLSFANVLALASWRDKRLFSCSQAGLVNNLNDGMAWGLFPLMFASFGYSIERVGVLAAVYPATWGILQIATGHLSDTLGRRWMIAAGMGVQGIALVSLLLPADWLLHLTAMAVLGLGTAMVYPTLLAAVSDIAHPDWRASAVGVYRLWRDLGYALGAVIAGAVADYLGVRTAIATVGVLTLLSGVVSAVLMKEQRHK